MSHGHFLSFFLSFPPVFLKIKVYFLCLFQWFHLNLNIIYFNHHQSQSLYTDSFPSFNHVLCAMLQTDVYMTICDHLKEIYLLFYWGVYLSLTTLMSVLSYYWCIIKWPFVCKEEFIFCFLDLMKIFVGFKCCLLANECYSCECIIPLLGKTLHIKYMHTFSNPCCIFHHQLVCRVFAVLPLLTWKTLI